MLQDGVGTGVLADGVLDGNTGQGYRLHRFSVVRAGLVETRMRT